jgi:hypothetical protein
VAWRRLYESCISETNPDKLKKLVFQLEEAIVLRYHDLANEPKAFEELQAIKRAAQRVLRLKIEKLGSPDTASAVAMPQTASGPASIPASFQAISFPRVSLQPFPFEPVSSAIDANAATIPRRRFRAAWQKFVSQIQVALFLAERAWQNWVFKNSK